MPVLPGGPFDDRAARPQRSTPARILHDSERGAILHRSAGIEKFGLAQNAQPVASEAGLSSISGVLPMAAKTEGLTPVASEGRTIGQQQPCRWFLLRWTGLRGRATFHGARSSVHLRFDWRMEFSRVIFPPKSGPALWRVSRDGSFMGGKLAARLPQALELNVWP